MKPLDFVKTPKGGFAIIKEIDEYDGGKIQSSIIFIGDLNPGKEKNAWWREGELEVIDSLPSLLARELPVILGNGRANALKAYPKPNNT